MKKFTRRKYTAPGKINGTDTDFVCRHCGAFVLANTALSGVHNRNHCPYCLASRHMDLFEAGDRLCACKGTMHPIGLTFKQSHKKYTGQSELMLVHECDCCGKFSINRIARDDEVSELRAVLQQSLLMDEATQQELREQNIHLLNEEAAALPLFGEGSLR